MAAKRHNAEAIENGKSGAPVLIAIAGGSGAGKSWLAEQLRRHLGKESTILSLDNFYLDRSHLAPRLRARVNFDHPRAIDWKRFDRVLTAIKAGEAVEIPSYDFSTHSCRSEGKAWKPRRYVLVEGLWTLRSASLRRHFACSIFLECAEETRLQRRLTRDAAQRGRTEESIRLQFKNAVAPMHQRHVAPQSRWADVALRSPLAQGEIEALAERLKQL